MRPRSKVGYTGVRIHCRRGKAENVNRFHLLDAQFLGSCRTGSSSPTVRAPPTPSPLPARDEPPPRVARRDPQLPSIGRQTGQTVATKLFVGREILGQPQPKAPFQNGNLWSWLINISPENEGLLQHVRSLSYTRVRQRYSLEPEYTIRAFGGYLQSFQQLRHLSLSSIRIPSAISNQIMIFSAFQHTLSRLSFEDCSITISALATLIGYFPSLDHLDLIDPLYNIHGPPAVPLSRPPVSKLRISDRYRDIFVFLKKPSGFGLVFNDIAVDYLSRSAYELGRIVHAWEQISSV